jgi:hypothetical protein
MRLRNMLIINCILAVIIIITGAAVVFYIIFKNLEYVEKQSYRFVVPGEIHINLNEKGRYTIFYEYQSKIGNTVYSTNPDMVPNLSCTLTDLNGNEIGLSPEPGYEKYSSFGGFCGTSLLKFDISEPGEYILKANYNNSNQENQIVLAVTFGFIREMFKSIVILGMVVLVTAALIISLIIFTAYKAYKKMYPMKKNES